MIDPQLHKRVEDKVLNVLLDAQHRFNRIFKLPTIEYKQMGRTSGKALYKDNVIILNPDFFKNHAEEMINRTLPHEIAHILSYEMFGAVGVGHGRWWKYVMVHLGLQAERCHTYSLEGVKVRRRKVNRALYRCPVCGSNLSVSMVNHNRISSGNIRWHKNCGNSSHPIVFLGMD